MNNKIPEFRYKNLKMKIEVFTSEIDESVFDSNIKPCILSSFNIPEGMVNSTTADYWVFVKDDVIASMAISEIIKTDYSCEFYLFGISVMPEYRKQGYARKLLESAISFARERDVDALSLNISLDVGDAEVSALEMFQKDNQGSEVEVWRQYREMLCAFYESCGFVSDSDIKIHADPKIIRSSPCQNNFRMTYNL